MKNIKNIKQKILTIVKVSVFIPEALELIGTLSPLDQRYVTVLSSHHGNFGDISQVKMAVFPISISSLPGNTITSNLVISRVQLALLVWYWVDTSHSYVPTSSYCTSNCKIVNICLKRRN